MKKINSPHHLYSNFAKSVESGSTDVNLKLTKSSSSKGKKSRAFKSSIVYYKLYSIFLFRPKVPIIPHTLKHTHLLFHSYTNIIIQGYYLYSYEADE